MPNPKLEVFSISEVTAIGRKKGFLLILDNSPSPILAPPFDHDTAIVVHLLPKYIGRHGTPLGGVTINGGNFDWREFPKRRPTLNTLDDSYHGAIWAEGATPLGPIAYILKVRVTLLDDLGSATSPQNASQHLGAGDAGAQDLATFKKCRSRWRFSSQASGDDFVELSAIVARRGGPSSAQLSAGWLRRACWI